MDDQDYLRRFNELHERKSENRKILQAALIKLHERIMAIDDPRLTIAFIEFLKTLGNGDELQIEDNCLRMSRHELQRMDLIEARNPIIPK